MKLKTELQKNMNDFLRRRDWKEKRAIKIDAEDCWSLKIICDLPQLPELCIRSMNGKDVSSLQNFGARLGPVSKDLFCPYPWDEPEELLESFRKAIERTLNRIDASYLIEIADHEVIGHFFLWKAGGNPHSRQHHVQVPELGVAIADEWQGKGLGGLAVRILQAVAVHLGADAVELTTALNNEAGWKTYLRCGFQYTGMIRNPLEVNVTAAFAGEETASKYREERQMVFIINEEQRNRVLDYLAMKREDAAKE
jgi:RimJ/RimL family protein N-acetyltransferase